MGWLPSTERRGTHQLTVRQLNCFGGLTETLIAIVGQSLWQVFPELRGTIVEKEIRRALENGVRIQYEYLFPTDQRWYEVQGYPSAEGVILLFRDITDRKAPTS